MTGCTQYQNVDCFGWSVDDTIAVMSGSSPTSDIAFTNFLGCTECSGASTGWNSMESISGLKFVNCEWYSSKRGLLLHQLKEGNSYGDIVLSNCWYDDIKERFVDTVGPAFESNGEVGVENIEFHHCRLEKPAPSNLQGDPGRKVKKLTFDDFQISSRPIKALSEMKGFKCSGLEEILFTP